MVFNLLKQIHYISFLWALLIACAQSYGQNKSTFGWVEKVKILPSELTIAAKLDTGAENCSLHASNLREFSKDGKKWARFEISDQKGQSATVEKEILSRARIKSVHGKFTKRPVVKLGLCLGSEYMEVEVNLQDRSDRDFSMLIGRNFLAGTIIVDSAVMYTREPNCTNKNGKQ